MRPTLIRVNLGLILMRPSLIRGAPYESSASCSRPSPRRPSLAEGRQPQALSQPERRAAAGPAPGLPACRALPRRGPDLRTLAEGSDSDSGAHGPGPGPLSAPRKSSPGPRAGLAPPTPPPVPAGPRSGPAASDLGRPAVTSDG